jgi:hypothetical protein
VGAVAAFAEDCAGVADPGAGALDVWETGLPPEHAVNPISSTSSVTLCRISTPLGIIWVGNTRVSASEMNTPPMVARRAKPNVGGDIFEIISHITTQSK